MNICLLNNIRWALKKKDSPQCKLFHSKINKF